MKSWALEGQSSEGVNKKRIGEQVRLSGETKTFGYLSHLCSQKSDIAEICDSGEKYSRACGGGNEVCVWGN